MNLKRAAALIAAGALALGVIVYKLLMAAQLMPPAAAVEAADVDHAFHVMIVLSVVFYAGIVAYLAYCLVHFRARGAGEEGARFDGSRGGLLEKAWIAGSLVLTLALAAFGSQELYEIIGNPRADMDVQVTGSQFSWEFYYPALDAYGSRLVLPGGKRVRILVSSTDVVHSFWVPEFRLKQDALPGRVVPLTLTPTLEGTYQLRCAELCGLEHTDMTAWVDVVAPEEFESRLKGEEW